MENAPQYLSIRNPRGTRFYLYVGASQISRLIDAAFDNQFTPEATTPTIYQDQKKYGRSHRVLTDKECDNIITKIEEAPKLVK